MKYSSNQLFSAENAIETVKNRTYMQIWGAAFLRFFIGWCFFSGVIVLLFRILHLGAPYFLVFICGIPLAFIFGIDFANKHPVPKNVCVASIDAYNKAGGLLIAEFETGDKSWRLVRKALYAIPNNKNPYNYKQLFGILILALLFVWGSFCIPLMNFKHFTNRRINLSKKVSEIKEQIDLLQQEDVISKEECISLENALEDIVKNSDNESPGITFEALDQMAEKLRYEASEEMKKRIKDMEVLKKLEKFAKDAKKKAGESKKVQEELDKLKKQLRQSGMSESQINDLLKQHFGNSNSANGMNSGNMDNISQSLKDSIDQKMLDSSELAQRMLEKNLIDEKTSEKLKQSMESKGMGNSEDGKENSFFDVDNNQNKDNSNNKTGENSGQSGQEGGQSGQEGDQSGQEGGQSGQEGGQSGQEGGQSGQEGGQSGLEDGQSGQEGGQSGQEGGQSKTEAILGGDGSGGISRGGGRTPMSYGDKASDHNTKYHDKVLPPVNPESVLGATTLGIGIADPEINKEKEKYSAGNIKHMDKVENTLSKKNILPKHRNAVKNYFTGKK